MDIKIQELTEKIYKEGVEKGNEEAGRIIAEANAQKESILSEAEAEAKRIVAAAEKQASELKKNTEAELKLFASQSVEALKSEVVNLITGVIAGTVSTDWGETINADDKYNVVTLSFPCVLVVSLSFVSSIANKPFNAYLRA